MNKHPAIVMQYQTGNLVIMKCPQHGTHLVVAHLAPIVSPCHFEVTEAAELLKALEEGPAYGALRHEKPEHRVSFHRVKGGDWGVQVFDNEPDVTWFTFAAPAPAPSSGEVALNAEGRRKLHAAVLETLYGKTARA